MARATISPYNTMSAPPGRSNQHGKFVSLAALPVQLPMRKGVGVRHLAYASILTVFMGLMAAHFFFNVHINLFSFFGGGVGWVGLTQIRNYAIAWAVLTIIERRKRIREEKAGRAVHSWNPGVSRFNLELLPLPARWIAIAVEPGLAFLCAAAVRRLGYGPLGIVLMISAVCFAISQLRVAENIKQDIRDRNDMALENEWTANVMKGQAQAGEGPRKDAGEGLSTGLDGLNIKPQAEAQNSAVGGE